MFSSKHSGVYLDLSAQLRESQDWNVGTLRIIDYLLNPVSFAIEPLSGLLAVGTFDGVIYIFGRPGVVSRLTIPDSPRIKLLQFSVSVFTLICVDEREQLHVFDLTSYGQPQLRKSTRFNSAINSLTLSPSHTHAFLALQSGEIKTYDLISLRKSPYVIPNMWAVYEKQLATSGLLEPSNPASCIPVDVVLHPRDLNLVFIAYGGGVILSDLMQRNTVRAYELVIPAGAPGGCGYDSSDLMTHRHPPVTCMAIHPTGHLFVVGHVDGTIAFWAIDDEDHPLFVRTIDNLEEVNVVDGTKIEQYLSSGNVADRSQIGLSDREPIFKITWSGFPNSSDPRGGETALTILGGLKCNGGSGVTVMWLPPFNPPEPPAPTGTQSGLHPFIRKAMRQSLLPSKSFFYATIGSTQDFLLIPRDSPHFAGTYDPVSILLLSDFLGGTRTIEAFQFPPPEFLIPTSVAPGTISTTSSTVKPSDDISEDLVETLQAMGMSDDPKRLEVPVSLWDGNGGIIHAQIVQVERDAYEILTAEADVNDGALPLTGGVAWSKDITTTDTKLLKYQAHRILVTSHHNLTVQFQDISGQLLLSSDSCPLQKHFPCPLHTFTIDLTSLLTDGSVQQHISPTCVSKASIHSVHLATESLECAIVLVTGELFLYRLTSTGRADPLHIETEDKELLIVEHVLSQSNQKYHPYFMLAPGLGAVTSCALSDIGFLATAYADGSLFIVDMRGPKIVLHVGHNATKHKHLPVYPGKNSSRSDTVNCLSWTVCGLSKDPHPRIRLLASHASGFTRIFSLSRPSHSSLWVVDMEPTETETLSNPVPNGSFIVDAKTGTLIKADRNRLAASLQSDGNLIHGLWVTVGSKGVRCIADITGERIAKADWNNKIGGIESVQIIDKNGSCVLVAFTDKNKAVVYSLPHLEYLQTLHLPESDIALSVDTTGDFIAFKRHFKSNLIEKIILSSLFHTKRSFDFPDVDFVNTSLEVPSQPKPVSVGPASLLRGTLSWLGGGGGLTGEQVDALLAGPDRPIPQTSKVQASAAVSGPPLTSRVSGEAQGTQSNLYERLASALTERGQALGDLEDKFHSLEEGSKGMVNQAKRLAAKQGTKNWFGL